MSESVLGPQGAGPGVRRAPSARAARSAALAARAGDLAALEHVCVTGFGLNRACVGRPKAGGVRYASGSGHRFAATMLDLAVENARAQAVEWLLRRGARLSRAARGRRDTLCRAIDCLRRALAAGGGAREQQAIEVLGHLARHDPRRFFRTPYEADRQISLLREEPPQAAAVLAVHACATSVLSELLERAPRAAAAHERAACAAGRPGMLSASVAAENAAAVEVLLRALPRQVCRQVAEREGVVFVATRKGDERSARALISHGVDISAREPGGTRSLLLYALHHLDGSPARGRIVAAVLEAGADPGSPGCGPRHSALAFARLLRADPSATPATQAIANRVVERAEALAGRRPGHGGGRGVGGAEQFTLWQGQP